MGTVYFIIAVLSVGLLVWYVVNKLGHGGSCCSGHEAAPKRIKPKDRDLSNYAYRYAVGVEGMVCTNCLRRVENAFNSNEGIYAKGSLENKTVRLYSKRELTRREAVGMLDGSSYTITGFMEEEK
ncbi:MAG: ATPase P [Ruminococcus sp.]|nr:ATPase P [Ruminococcus sp.]